MWPYTVLTCTYTTLYVYERMCIRLRDPGTQRYPNMLDINSVSYSLAKNTSTFYDSRWLKLIVHSKFTSVTVDGRNKFRRKKCDRHKVERMDPPLQASAPWKQRLDDCSKIERQN